MLDLIFTDGSPCWSKETNALGLARGGVDSEENLLQYRVYGSVVALYMFSLGRIRTISIWTILACIVGPHTFEILSQQGGFIKEIDPLLYKRLRAWLEIEPSTVLPQYPEIHPAIELIESLCTVNASAFFYYIAVLLLIPPFSLKIFQGAPLPFI